MTQPSQTPHPPYEEFRTAIGDHPDGNAALDDLQRTLHDQTPPSRSAVEERVGRLRGIPQLEARIANWWDAPATQQWLMILNDAGL